MSMVEEAASAAFFLPLDKLVGGEDNMEAAMKRAVDTIAGGVTLFWRLVEKPGYIRLDADRIRRLVRSTRSSDYAKSGEIKLVEGVMDQFALHVREHGKEMTPEQVGDLRNVLSRYELIVMTWREKKTNNYHIRQNTLDTLPYAKEIETNIQNSR